LPALSARAEAEAGLTVVEQVGGDAKPQAVTKRSRSTSALFVAGDPVESAAEIRGSIL